MSARFTTAGLALLFHTACVGTVVTPDSVDSSPDAPGPQQPGNGGGSGNGGGTIGGGGAVIPGQPAPVTATTLPLRRLTHEQWLATIRTALGLQETPDFGVGRLPPDRGDVFVFGQDPTSLEVDVNLYVAYRERAGQIADFVVRTPANLSSVMQDQAISASTVRDLAARMARVAFRRPPTAAELDALAGLYDIGVANPIEDLSPPQSGLHLLIRGLFESPAFLYVSPPRNEQDDSQPVPLSDHDLAHRMAMFIWDDGPDQALMAAADAGQLHTDEQIRTQAARMMDDPRFEDVLFRFHNAALGGLAAFNTEEANLQAAAREERSRFVQHVARSGGGWREILTSNVGFANATLAEAYGLTGDFSEGEFRQIELDPSQRRGALTQLGFLGGVKPTPIHRGVWTSRMIACNEIGLPQNVMPPRPPEFGESRREVYEAITEQPGSVCADCHSSLINPFGFTFESYDDMGRFRTQYGEEYFSVPINPQVTTALIDGEQRAFGSALELIDALATSRGAHNCYGRHWTEFAMERPWIESDRGLIESLGNLSYGGASMQEMVQFIVQSASFRYHARDN